MTANLLKLDDLRGMNSPEAIANVFKRLGYNKVGCPVDVSYLDVSAPNAKAVYEAHLIADQDNGELQVLLLQLQPSEWETSSTASTRMKAIATQVSGKPTEFLLLATKDYNQLMLVNPRKTVDDKQNVKVNIRKLLIDRTNPTNYDRERLESLAVNGKSPKELYKTHCEEFDVEKLTKSFYKGYKELFERVQAAVRQYNPDPYFDDADRLHQFSQRLLGRIMFLYFLQKKEFLAGDRRFLTTQYKIVHREENEFDYYQTVLEPLFFDTLNKQRPNFDSQWGKIPYLNGGLFDRDYGPEIRDTAGRETPEAITLPNNLFNPGNTESILFYFNSYNFTVAENVAGDEDIAVDPEMLGKVFENMLAAEERGKSGTFYTPRGIVQFMCSEVLARYLVDETGMELDKVQELINYDPDVTPEKIKELISPQQAKALKKAIEEIKVLDPAVGSGAFPLGMMQLLLSVRQAVARREGMTVQRGSLTISQWKREIIANNLYGVDIKPEAIEIAKLRMWLSLVVDIPRIEDVEPLPNLDYKLMCGDSLISTIHGEQLIPDPTKEQQGMLAVTPIQQAIQPLLELQHRYFDAQSEERHELRKQILEAEANVFRVAVCDRRDYWKGKQAELERKIWLMKKEPTKAQENQLQDIKNKLAELDKFAQEVESGDRSLNFFQYHLHFRDVFDKKGGFDIVIGNPPYDVYEGHRKEQIEEVNKVKIYDKAKGGKLNTYKLFLAKCLDIQARGGFLTLIFQNSFLADNSAAKLRDYCLKQTRIIQIDSFPERDDSNKRVFESAKMSVCIVLLQSVLPENSYEFNLNTWEDREMKYGKSVLHQSEFLSEYSGKNSIILQVSNEEIKILQSLLQNNYLVKLETVAKCYQGEINLTTHRKFLTDQKNNNDQLIKGASIQKWFITEKMSQGDVEYLDSNLYLYAHKGQKSLHHKKTRIVTQGITGIDEKWRLKASIINPGIYCAHSVNYILITSQEINDKYLLGLINSKLINWLFKLSSTNSNVNSYEVHNLLIPKISLKQQMPIIEVVQKILDLTENKHKSDIYDLEKKLNELVYSLYNLQKEDIQIIGDVDHE